ncbi:helix-turn-helix domain-containing protein [Brucella cytisi]|nr:helix-turn-helix transcriptional regulator [Brucella cytisi]
MMPVICVGSLNMSVPSMKITVRDNLLTVNHKITVRVIFLVEGVLFAYFKDMITAAQIRAARALLNWKQTDLASASGVSEMSVKNLEKGQTDPRVSTLRAIENAFAQSGIEFISTPENEGVVRIRNRQP